jgi:hypothetical protein
VFTFLVTLTVIMVAIAGAMAIAIKDPDQPATLRERSRREPSHRRAKRPRPAARARETTQAAAASSASTVQRNAPGGFGDQRVAAPAGPSGWVRLRSGVVLTLLLAVVGALVAAGIAGVVILVALALRSAVS